MLVHFVNKLNIDEVCILGEKISLDDANELQSNSVSIKF